MGNEWVGPRQPGHCRAGTRSINFSLCSQHVPAPPGLAATRGECKLLRAQVILAIVRRPPCSVPPVPLITHSPPPSSSGRGARDLASSVGTLGQWPAARPAASRLAGAALGRPVAASCLCEAALPEPPGSGARSRPASPPPPGGSASCGAGSVQSRGDLARGGGSARSGARGR